MLLKKPRRSLRGAQLRRHVAGDVAGLRVHPSPPLASLFRKDLAKCLVKRVTLGTKLDAMNHSLTQIEKRLFEIESARGSQDWP